MFINLKETEKMGRMLYAATDKVEKLIDKNWTEDCDEVRGAEEEAWAIANDISAKYGVDAEEILWVADGIWESINSFYD